MPIETHVFESSLDGVIARHGPVFINVWRTSPSVEQLKRLHIHEKTCGVHVVMTIVREVSKASRMTDAARDYSKVIFEDMKAHVRAQANVIEGSGFFAAAARAVMMSTGVFKGGGYDAKIFSKVDDASVWLEAYARPLDAAYDAKALTRAIATLDHRFD